VRVKPYYYIIVNHPKRTKMKLYSFLGIVIVLIACNSNRQGDSQTPIEEEFISSSKLYAINTPQVDITYGIADDSTALKLDVYLASEKVGGPKNYIRHHTEKRATLLFIHGGAWVSGDKSTSIFEIMPYVEKGWQVVNINYRFATGRNSIADCVSDVNRALDWIVENADTYYFDINKIVVAGDSAGGHLALMLGVANTSNTKIAAVVNWYGITDVKLCLDTWDNKDFVNDLMEDTENFGGACKTLSPITYVTKKTPPIITVHGTNDQTVPYNQGKLLHEKLEELKVPNYLLTLEGKKHGDFNPEDMALITKTTFEFLKKHGID